MHLIFKLDVGPQYKPPRTTAQSLILVAFFRTKMDWGSWDEAAETRQQDLAEMEREQILGSEQCCYFAANIWH